ncbi:NADH-quinone oxidoreductase subunit M [Streptosporangium album]|uniref:NADH-quinone oxidoreductase subunit M n=3 Tax=Streptosporangium album TaxID=47479 RepID=A0A7W7S3B7_9ACTN|nr:NADH-quinone oxidoreductase subunit M [Streptosporangium album]
MIALVPLLVAGLLLAGSSTVTRIADGRLARRAAVSFAAAATALSIVLPLVCRYAPFAGARTADLVMVALPDGAARPVATVTCVVGLLVVAMSPIASHPPATLAGILRLLAISSGSVVVRDGGVAAVLWALSAWLVWAELRRRDSGDGLDRLFAMYHVPSVLFFGVGTALTAAGSPETGTALVVLGTVIRSAVIPVHGWYPRFVERAPLGVVVAFGAAPLGVLTQLELLSARSPGALAHEVALIGGLTAVAAAVFGVVQNSARRALAFLAMSQSGLIAFGLGNGSPVAVSGAVLTWQASALALSGTAMALAALEARRGTLSLAAPGGNFARTPRLAAAFLLCGLAAVGFPPSLGFAGGHLLVHGSAGEFPLLWPALIGAVGVNGMTVMRSFFALFTGSRVHRGERDLRPLEACALMVVVTALLLGAVLPVIPVPHVPAAGSERSDRRTAQPVDP